MGTEVIEVMNKVFITIAIANVVYGVFWLTLTLWFGRDKRRIKFISWLCIIAVILAGLLLVNFLVLGITALIARP